MTTPTLRILGALALLATTLPAQTRDTSVSAAIDRVFDIYRGTEGPGCAVGVARNGQVIHARGYGMANLETRTPISPNTIFHVASVSKQFTAMAILLLETKLSTHGNAYVSTASDLQLHRASCPRTQSD